MRELPDGTAQVHASVAELGNDWYLDRIEVTGPEGVCWAFPCDAWLGRSEGDDYTGVQPTLHCFFGAACTLLHAPRSCSKIQ